MMHNKEYSRKETADLIRQLRTFLAIKGHRLARTYFIIPTVCTGRQYSIFQKGLCLSDYAPLTEWAASMDVRIEYEKAA